MKCKFIGSTTIRNFWMVGLKGKGTKGRRVILLLSI